MSEFSRRCDVEIIKDEPLTCAEFVDWSGLDTGRVSADFVDDTYRRYLDRFQPYRWRAVAANNEPIAHGESYFNEADCLNAVNLLAGDDTTVFATPMYGSDRGGKVLRYGRTDREHRAGTE